MTKERRQRPERAGQYASKTYKALQKALADNVLLLREEHGWTQEEAAHRCEIATRLLQRVEAKDVNLTLTTLARLCDGFGVLADRLFATAGRRR